MSSCDFLCSVFSCQVVSSFLVFRFCSLSVWCKSCAWVLLQGAQVGKSENASAAKMRKCEAGIFDANDAANF